MKFQMNEMMKQLQKLQNDMARVQEELAEKQVEAESGGGMVKAVANGRKEIVNILIDQELINSNDKEMLEDLVVAAVNKAIEAASKMAEEEMASVTKGMVPPGMNIPGF
ncbi:MAG: YbaB/EbfC family nucleoid-associated protein [Ignavibacteriales bacterium]|nr:YbaB/EbfC family nucleoid-associated protein [Ignavibacteriales bacterium]